MKQLKTIFATLTSVAIIAVGFVLFSPNTPEVEGLLGSPTFQGVATSTIRDIGSGDLNNDNSTYRILATSTLRYYAILCNTGSQHAYMSMASDTEAVALMGIPLFVGSCYELVDNENLYIGSIKAITLTGSTTISITDVPLPVK